LPNRLRVRNKSVKGPLAETPEVGPPTKSECTLFAQIPVRSKSLWYNGAKAAWGQFES